MKSFIIAAAAIFNIITAFPHTLTASTVQGVPLIGTQLYQLQSKSSITTVNNQWVSLKTGATTYGLSSTQAAASKFWVRIYPPTGTFSVINVNGSEIALTGTTSVLLNVVESPGIANPGGTLIEWGTFTMNNDVLGVNDGSALTSRTFVAVQATGGYSLAFYDGVSSTTATITPITLAIVKAGTYLNG